MQAFPPKSFIKQFVTGKVAIEILKTKLHVIYVHAGRLLEVKPLFRAVKARLVSMFISIPRTNLIIDPRDPRRRRRGARGG